MKRLITLVMLVVAMTATTFASEHLSFLGIPMNGTVEQFCNKLVSQKGLTIVDRSDEGVYSLEGRFNGLRNCEFYVFPNDDTGQVYKVDVYLPKDNSWSALKGRYNRTVRDFRSDSDWHFDEEGETFESPYSEGDGDEMVAVENEKCNYYTDFIGSGGWVRIKISRWKQVLLRFYDFANFPSDNDNSGSSTNQTAMQFMGVDMRGNFKSFAQKLVNQKNFSIVRQGDTFVELSGQFTGEECEIYVFGTDQTKQVWKVTVYLPKLNTWNALKRQYLKYKEAFDNKYTVDSEYSYFEDPYNEGDGNELEGVRNEKCHYVTFYDADGGSVWVTISEYQQLQLNYEDATNVEIKRQEEGGSNSGSSSISGDI